MSVKLTANDLEIIWSMCWGNPVRVADYYMDNGGELNVNYTMSNLNGKFGRSKQALLRYKRQMIRGKISHWDHGVPRCMRGMNNWQLYYKLRLKKNGVLYRGVYKFCKWFSLRFNHNFISKNQNYLLDIFLVHIRAIENKKIYFWNKRTNQWSYKPILSSCEVGFHRNHLYGPGSDIAFGFIFVWKHPTTNVIRADHFCLHKCEAEVILNGNTLRRGRRRQ